MPIESQQNLSQALNDPVVYEGRPSLARRRKPFICATIKPASRSGEKEQNRRFLRALLNRPLLPLITQTQCPRNSAGRRKWMPSFDLYMRHVDIFFTSAADNEILPAWSACCGFLPLRRRRQIHVYRQNVSLLIHAWTNEDRDFVQQAVISLGSPQSS